MAVAFKASLGNVVSTTSGNGFSISTTATIAIGDFIVVRVAADNLSATTPTISSCTDGTANAYTVQRQGAVNATAAAGVMGAIITCKAVTACAAGTNIQVLFSGSIAHKAMYAESFTGVENTVRSAAVGATGTATAASAGASGTVNAGDLVLGHIANETRGAITGDTDTTNGSWSTLFQQRSATSGSDATCASVAGQYKIATATGAQTYNVTAVASEWLCQCVVLQASPEPSVTQAAYGFYDDAGTESGAAALVAQDTAISANKATGDGVGCLRVRLQNSTANSGFSTDDYQLQHELNASGSWSNVGTGAVVVYDNPNLTEGAVTTRRLTVGTGSFVAGKVSEDGTVNDFALTASNYTEIVFSVKILAASVSAGDTLRFRVLRNGVTTGMTYTAVPTINVVNIVPAITQAAYGFYADGTETGSTALTAQDTAPTVSVISGNVNLQLRTRLQSTTAIAVPATDDWQLQFEHNASGFWTNVIASGFESAPGSNIVAACANGTSLNLANRTGVGQSFIGNGKPLINAVFWLSKAGTPAATSVRAYLYAHTGTYGSATTGMGSGAPLATSTNTITTASLNTSGTPNVQYTFNFDGTFKLSAGTPYVIMVDIGTTGDGSHYVIVGYGGGSASGNMSYLAAGVWSAAGLDLAAEVYTSPGIVFPYNSSNLTDGAATTNRLTGGTGTFVPGKISETGLVSNAGWAGNNYTELLYALNIVNTDVGNGDTLRFRVLRNGAAAEFTYTQIPTINVTKTTGPPNTGSATDGYTWTPSAAGVQPTVPKTGTATTSWAEASTSTGARTPKGASTVVYAQALTSAGKRDPKGSITASYVEALTSAGKRAPKGDITAAHTWISTATGVKPAEAPKTGTATVAHAWAVTAAGINVNPLTVVPWSSVYWASDPSWTPPANGAGVSSWRDAGVAPFNLTQGTALYQPVYRSSYAALNNKPAIDFDGTTVLRNTATPTLYQPNHIIAIGWLDATAANEATITDSGAANRNLFRNRRQSGDISLYAGAGAGSPGAARIGPFIISALFNGSASIVRSNGVTYGVNANVGTLGFSHFSVGGYVEGQPQYGFKGALVFVGVAEVLTVSQLAELDRWAKSYYSVPIVNAAAVFNTWTPAAIGKKTPKGSKTVTWTVTPSALGLSPKLNSATVHWHESFGVIDDTFDGPAATPLTSRGYGPMVVTPNLVLDGNGNAMATVGLDVGYGGNINLTPVADDVAAELVFRFHSTTDAYTQLGIRSPINPTGFNIGYHVAVGSVYNFTTPGVALYRQGERVTQALFTWTTTQDYVLRLEISGQNLKVKVDGVEILTYTDLSPLMTGSHVTAYIDYAYETTSDLLRSLRAGTSTAVGTRTSKGASTTIHGWTTSAVGISPIAIPPDARLDETGAVRNTEAGVVRNLESAPEEPPKTGTGTTTWSVTPVAAGRRASQGLSTTSYVEDPIAVGKRIPKGAPTTTYVEALSTVGKRTPKGAVTTTYAETLTSAGKRTPSSTVITTWTETPVTVGKRTPKSTVTTAHAWAPTAAGVKPIVGIKQGNAIVGWATAPAAAGKITAKGTATVPYAETPVTAGKRVPKGTTTVAYTEVVPSAPGKKTPKSAVITTALQTPSAAGKKTPKGVNTLAHVWSVIAQGVKPVVGIKQGSGLVAHDWAPAAVGKRAPIGASTTTDLWTPTAAGKKIQKSTVTTNWAEAPTSAGKRFPKSTLTTNYAETLASVGKRTPKGNRSITNTWAVAAAGIKPLVGFNQGVGIVTNSWATAAVGKKAPKGLFTISNAWVPTAAGKKLQKATVTTSFAWAPTSLGKRVPKGLITVAYVETVSVAGRRVTKGVSFIIVSYVPVALGLKGKAGYVEGMWNGQAVVAMQYGDKPVVEWMMLPA